MCTFAANNHIMARIMGKFINPFTDIGFKIIFGQEFSKPRLLDFLNALLVGERIITDLRFLDKTDACNIRWRPLAHLRHSLRDCQR